MAETIEEMKAKIELYKEAQRQGDLSFESLPLHALMSQLNNLPDEQTAKLPATVHRLVINPSTSGLDISDLSTDDLKALTTQLESEIELDVLAYEKALSALRTLFPYVEKNNPR